MDLRLLLFIKDGNSLFPHHPSGFFGRKKITSVYKSEMASYKRGANEKKYLSEKDTQKFD